MERFSRGMLGMLVFVFMALACVPAHALTTLSVVDELNNPVANFRWTLEMDTTYPVTPGVHDPNSIGTGISKSHAPVVATGDQSTLAALYAAVNTAERYFISVLPDQGAVQTYTLSGAPIAAGQAAVTVRVHTHPIPTGQMVVYVFHDNFINGIPDPALEAGLAGFQVKISDFLGDQMNDVFGNALGTTYQTDGAGNYIIVDGAPVVLTPGNGIFTNISGIARIKNLASGAYAVHVAPPDNTWVQTTAIGGGPGLGTAIRANEPTFLVDFGLNIRHAAFGFIHPMPTVTVFPPPAPGTPLSTITGRAVQTHSSAPANQTVSTGRPLQHAWVALLNKFGRGEQVYTAPADPVTGEFTITGVPPSTYNLVIWDSNLLAAMVFPIVIIPPSGAPGGVFAMGDVPCPMWFGSLEGSVFYDINENGVRDAGEVGMIDQAINIRYPDGSIQQATTTLPPNGEFAINTIPSFAKWLVAEVDFARFKVTGATFDVDAGAKPGDTPGTFFNPQAQFPTDYVDDVTTPQAPAGPRTELGPVLLEGMMIFPDQVNFADFGKKSYVVGLDNIPGNGDDIPGENGGIAGIVFYATTRAEDDPRYGLGEPWEPGIPSVEVRLYQVNERDASGKPVIVEARDFVDAVFADSWDASLPTGCADDSPGLGDCAEAMSTWNQMRPGVFDGGWAFMELPPPAAPGTPLPSGDYVVRIVPPPGYDVLKYGSRNVDVGEQYTPSLLELPTPCVGVEYVIPEFLEIDGVTPNPAYDPANPGRTAPLCDAKEVRLDVGQNYGIGVDFFLYTNAPKAGRVVGQVTLPFAVQANPNNPRFGQGQAAIWIPVSLQDYLGREISRVYTDELGVFNALVPSTFSANVPAPSGVSPGVLQAVINHPGTAASPDPNYNPRYDTITLTFDSWPGRTTYLVAALGAINATQAITNLDCSPADLSPAISRVDGDAAGGGPYVAAAPADITITSMGLTQVPNPAFDPNVFPPDGTPEFITRDYGFGNITGIVTLGNPPVPLPITSWTDTTITATVPLTYPTGQLMVTRGDNGLQTKTGVTLHVVDGGYNPPVVRVPGDLATIQAAVDAAAAGSLILVAPGTYNENVIMYKPLRLQGYGAGSTTINAGFFDAAAQAAWDARLAALVAGGSVTLLENQDPTLALEKGAAITVWGLTGAFPAAPLNALIDGFSIEGALRGSGIFVNAYAPFTEISNNVVMNNQGLHAGGVRVGTPVLVNLAGTGYVSSPNSDVYIHDNLIARNGGTNQGGGIGLFNGATNYMIVDNCVCGNLTPGPGGGVNISGVNNNGWTAHNDIVFNQSSAGEGGGLFIGGELPPVGAPLGTLSPGAGNTTINANLILGNIGGDGGGLALANVNGQDVTNNPSTPANWYEMNITNNIIANNLTGDFAGGMLMFDAVNVNMFHNTIAYNDCTSSSTDNFGLVPGGLISTPNPAGVAGRFHTLGLQAAFGAGLEQTFPSPALYNNIIFNNRSWYWDGTSDLTAQPTGHLIPMGGTLNAPAQMWDLGVIGGDGTELMDPQYCVLTDNAMNAGYAATNVLADPLLASPLFTDLAAFFTAGQFNLINVYTTASPLSMYDHHLVTGSPAIDAGIALGSLPGQPYPVQLDWDIDDEARPMGASPDSGADEFTPAAPAPPVNVSVTAADGTEGVAQQVVAVWNDPNGAADINETFLQVGTVATGGETQVHYNNQTNLLYLLNDTGDAWLGGFAPGSANVIANSLLALDCQTTAVTALGNTLTVSFNLTPAVGFTGTKPLLMAVNDIAANSDGYETMGTWMISAVPAPTVPVLIAPPDGSALPAGISPTYSWTGAAAGSSFVVEFSRDPGFSAFRAFSAGTSTSFTPGRRQWRIIRRLARGGTAVYWRVRETTTGLGVLYSSPWSFTVVSTAPAGTAVPWLRQRLLGSGL